MLTGATSVPADTLSPGQIPDGSRQGLFLSADNLSQTGTTGVNGNAAAGTIRIGPRAGGSAVAASFADLQAASSNLYLLLGSGAAAGSITTQGLEIAYAGGGGSANLSGTVNGQTGPAAASIVHHSRCQRRLSVERLRDRVRELLPEPHPPASRHNASGHYTPPVVTPVISAPVISTPAISTSVISTIRPPAFFLLTDTRHHPVLFRLILFAERVLHLPAGGFGFW